MKLKELVSQYQDRSLIDPQWKNIMQDINEMNKDSFYIKYNGCVAGDDDDIQIKIVYIFKNNDYIRFLNNINFKTDIEKSTSYITAISTSISKLIEDDNTSVSTKFAYDAQTNFYSVSVYVSII